MSDTDKHKLDTNAGKPPVSLIPLHALETIAQVLAHGNTKYARHNWRTGRAPYSALIDATLRHIIAYNEGEDNDAESGLSHLAHASANLLMLLEYARTGVGTDDRYK